MSAPDSFLLSDGLLACPACRGDVAKQESDLRCNGCGATYPVVDEIPVLVPQDPRLVDEAKARQAAFSDAEDFAFEVSRPHGTTALYELLLNDKFRRSVSELLEIIKGGRVLVVCGGSGMDAEFLARAGATVVSADISFGAAGRVRARASRYGFAAAPVVADTERLPFRDRSFDVAYVHDGLHHLERPLEGVAEMARVASHAVSITEPASAAITALAVRLGLALEREEAGNDVRRLTVDDVAAVLTASGFQVVEARRYAMYYRHRPGPISRLASKPAVLPAVTSTLSLLNCAIGRYGNKLVVQAARTA